MIYVLNQNETIADILEPNKERYYWNDLHVEDLEEGSETFEFTTNATIPDNSTIVLRTGTGDLKAFIVQRFRDLRNDRQEKTYYTDAEFLELRYTRILEPQLLGGQTPESALNFGLQGTRWQFGYTDANITADIEISEYMNVLKYIRLVATEMELELRFRVEFSDNSISARYVDLVQRTGLDNGKEIIFGKDMQSIERTVDTSSVVTALYGVGPADDNGNIMTIASVNGGKPYVEDLDALQRWGKQNPNGLEHRFDVFSPSVDQKYLTPTMLLDLTNKEFKRRLNSVVTYNVDAVDMYDMYGWEHERVHCGDTTRIKDEVFEPALYLEARVIRTERSYTDPSRNNYTLGDYIEIDPYNYKRYKSIETVLNQSKEKWNNAEENAVVRANDYTDSQKTTFLSEALVQAQEKIDEAKTQIEQAALDIQDAQALIDDTLANPQNYNGEFAGDLIADSLIVRGPIVSENATITGQITATEATFLNAIMEEATITGTLTGVDGTFVGTLNGVDGTFLGDLTIDNRNSWGIGSIAEIKKDGISGVVSVTYYTSSQIYRRATLSDGQLDLVYVNSETSNQSSNISEDGDGLHISDTEAINLDSDVNFNSPYILIKNNNRIENESSETGYCGVGGIGLTGSTGAIAGVGVNFRIERAYTPSSISFSKSASNPSGLNAQYVNLTYQGFWLYIEGNGTDGYQYWRGTYSTIG